MSCTRHVPAAKHTMAGPLESNLVGDGLMAVFTAARQRIEAARRAVRG